MSEEVRSGLLVIYNRLKQIEEQQYGLIKEMIDSLEIVLFKDNTGKYVVDAEILLESFKSDLNIFSKLSMSNKELVDDLKSILISQSLQPKSSKDLIDSINYQVPEAFGKEMEQLFFDDNYVVGIHGTSVNSDVITEKIFKEGLVCNHGNHLPSTVAIGENCTFNRILRDVYRPMLTEYGVIVVIPKDEMNGPMWKKQAINDSYNSSNKHACLLNPRYIYGFYLSHVGIKYNDNPEIIHNPNFMALENYDEYDIKDSYLCELNKVNKRS